MARSRMSIRPALLLLLLAGGCASRLPPPTDADALRASARWPGTTLANLVRGRALYIDHCSGCHVLHLPTERPPAAWPGIVTEMEKRSRLDPEKSTALVRYLVIAAEGR
jgi:mono/diheme cytochrome c family protein